MISVFSNFKNDIFKYASVQLISKGLSLAAIYIIAFLTTDEIFGYIALLQASFLVAITVFGFNLQSVFVRYYFSVPLNDILKTTLPILIILFFSSLFSSLFLFLFLSGNYKPFFLLPIIGFFCGFGFIVSIISRSNNQFGLYAFSELLRPILLFCLAFSLFFLNFNIVSAYISILFISSILVFLYSAFNFNKLVNLDVFEKKENISANIIFIYTFPLFLSQVMSLMNNVSDKYILNYYLDVEKVGLYGKAYIIGSSLGLFLDSLMLLWVPYAIKHKQLIINKYFKDILNLVYLTFFISFIILLLAYFIYKMSISFMGLSLEFILVFLIIISAFISRIGYQVLTPILNAYDKTAIVAKCSILSMLFGLVLNLILIPYLGLIAAAFSTLISFLFYSLLALFFTKKLSQTIYVKE